MCLLSFPLQSTNSSRKRKREQNIEWRRVVDELPLDSSTNRDTIVKELESCVLNASDFLEFTSQTQDIICDASGIHGWATKITDHIRKMVSVPAITTACYISSVCHCVWKSICTSFRSQFRRTLPTPSNMEWKDVKRCVLEGVIPPIKQFSGGEKALENYTNESLKILNENFRNETEMEAVIRVAVIVLDAVKGTKLTVQLQPSVKHHTTFTDFYFIVTENEDDIPKAFIKVKNVSVSVAMLETKPVAQALREAQIIISEIIPSSMEILPSSIIQVPFILTNSIDWSFGLVNRASGGKISIVEHFHLHSDLKTTGGESVQKIVEATKTIILGSWPTCSSEM